MPLSILIVKEDLTTRLPISSELNCIEDHDSFYFNVCKIATDLGLSFIPTIDSYGITVFNELQLDPVEKEILILRKQPNVDQKILDILQKAIDVARKSSKYILFVGD